MIFGQLIIIAKLKIIKWFALQFGSEKALDQMFDKVRNWIFSKKINEIDDIASITGNIQNLKLGFEYQEFVLDFNDGKISIMTKKDINRGRDITQIITNENNIVKSCTIIGWLPPVNLFMSQNTFNVPVFNFIGYQFENSDVTFCRLANMNSKNFLMCTTYQPSNIL